jgi:hypothetical protein
MGYLEIYKLHLQLIQTYKDHERRISPFKTQRDYYRDQLLLTEDIAQRIFVINQIVTIHEKERANLIQWCSDTYFKK